MRNIILGSVMLLLGAYMANDGDKLLLLFGIFAICFGAIWIIGGIPTTSKIYNKEIANMAAELEGWVLLIFCLLPVIYHIIY